MREPALMVMPEKIATVTCAELRPSLELGNDRGLFRYLLNDSDRLVLRDYSEINT